MKAMIGYGVFSKPDMLEWMIAGITENFPKRTEVEFYFEASDGECEEMLKVLGPDLLFLKGFPIAYGGSKKHILEQGVHRQFIERFMEGDCHVLIVPQDDNRFQRPLLPDLEKLWAQYGTDLGWISGRDGHDFGYANMVCSPFSESTGNAKTVLPIGEYREVRMMNTGPVVYFRHVIEKVGLPDADLPWYWWSDYSLRCHHAGLKNILLSMDYLHTKFGRVGHNPALYDDALVARCLKTFNERWAPVYGRNPL